MVSSLCLRRTDRNRTEHDRRIHLFIIDFTVIYTAHHPLKTATQNALYDRSKLEEKQM